MLYVNTEVGPRQKLRTKYDITEAVRALLTVSEFYSWVEVERIHGSRTNHLC